MKFVVAILIILFAFSCNDPMSTKEGTVKLFIKYASEKNIDKIYELLTPESKKKYSDGNVKLLRSDFQVNKYNVEKIRFRRQDRKNDLYYMEILLKDKTAGFITLKKINGRYYIKLD